MKARRLVGLAATAAFAFASSIAEAQSCGTMIQQRASLQGRMAQLVASYPGTHFVIGMCAAGASSSFEKSHDENDAMQTFAVCAGIGCALVGFQNCADIASQWFSMALESSEIDDKLKGC